MITNHPFPSDPPPTPAHAMAARREGLRKLNEIAERLRAIRDGGGSEAPRAIAALVNVEAAVAIVGEQTT